jgi:hypothetical protein
MIKCPHCGSTAQVRTITPMYFDEGYWKVQKNVVAAVSSWFVISRRLTRLSYQREGVSNHSFFARARICEQFVNN